MPPSCEKEVMFCHDITTLMNFKHFNFFCCISSAEVFDYFEFSRVSCHICHMQMGHLQGAGKGGGIIVNKSAAGGVWVRDDSEARKKSNGNDD
jgi:hypothetical protein